MVRAKSFSIVFIALSVLIASRTSARQQPEQPLLDAHFHHLHLNATDPKAAIEFYTTKFDAEKARFAGLVDAVWAQKSWLLFTKVSQPPKAEITSSVWHFGWGAEDMKATYAKQLTSGTRFSTPITDISDIGGNTGAKDLFYYAYVQGPDDALIELNTARHHQFGHLHLFSADPPAAAAWYMKYFGAKGRDPSTIPRTPRIYRDVQIGPSASLMMDNVNIIIFPIEYPKKVYAEAWKNRTEFDSTRGHVVDHIGFSVENLDAAVEKLRKAGVTLTEEIRSIGKIRFAFLEGPDKIRIELVEGHPIKEG